MSKFPLERYKEPRRSTFLGAAQHWDELAKDKTKSHRELFVLRRFYEKKLAREEKKPGKLPTDRKEEYELRFTYLDSLIVNEGLHDDRKAKLAFAGGIAILGLSLFTHVESAECPDKTITSTNRLFTELPDYISLHIGLEKHNMEIGAFVLRDVECTTD